MTRRRRFAVLVLCLVILLAAAQPTTSQARPQLQPEAPPATSDPATSTPTPTPVLRFDATSYIVAVGPFAVQESSTQSSCAGLTLRDPGGQFANAQTVPAQLRSQSGDRLAVTLRRTGPNSFATPAGGCVPVTTDPVNTADALLQATLGDVIGAAVGDPDKPLAIDVATVTSPNQPYFGDMIVAVNTAWQQQLPPALQSVPSGRPGVPNVPIGLVVQTPQGQQTGTPALFAENQVIFVGSNEDRDAFIQRRGATLLETVEIPLAPGNTPGAPTTQSFHVLRVDLTSYAVSTGQAAFWLDKAGATKGSLTYESTESMRLMALIAEEQLAGSMVLPHLLLQRQGTPFSNEGDGEGTTFNWFSDRWFNATGPRGRVRAGEALALLEIADWRSVGPQVPVAIIDGGFAAPDNFTPARDNPDYGRPFATIPQRSYNTLGGISSATSARDASPFPCSGDAPCPWHGTDMFSIAGAELNNSFGAAGVGAAALDPIFLEIDISFMLPAAAAVRDAVGLGAQVINLSSGVPCQPPLAINLCDGGQVAAVTIGCSLLFLPFLCEQSVLATALNIPLQADALRASVEFAASRGVVVVAAGGNTVNLLGNSLGPFDAEAVQVIPCVYAVVICVGALDASDTDLVPAASSGFGSAVDIWAPGVNVTSTIVPGGSGRPISSGTSAATAFVSGALALIRSLNPALTGVQARDLLMAARCRPGNTARILGPDCTPSGSARVNIGTAGPTGGGGYIDLLDAVRRAAAGGAPRVAALGACTGGWDERAVSADVPGDAINLGALTAATPLTRGGDLSVHALLSDDDWYRFTTPASSDGIASSQVTISLGFVAAAGRLRMEVFREAVSTRILAGRVSGDASGTLTFRGVLAAGEPHLVRVLVDGSPATNDTCYTGLSIAVTGVGIAGDRFESNEDLAGSRLLSSWENVEDLSAGIFDYGVDLPVRETAERWRMRVTNLSLSAADDRDFFRITLPNPGDPSIGGVADIDPRPSTTTPLPECGSTQRTDTRGTGSNVTIAGTVTVRILQPGTGRLLATPPPGDQLRVYRGEERVNGTLSFGTLLEQRIECPAGRLGSRELRFSFGERDDPRALFARYDIEIEYRITIVRGISDRLRDIIAGNEVRGFRTLCGGDIFPRCAGLRPGLDDRLRFDLIHPFGPITGCVAGGRNCESFSYFSWPGGRFDMGFTSLSPLSIALVNDELEVLGSTQLPGLLSTSDPAPESDGLEVLGPTQPPGLSSASDPALASDGAIALADLPAGVYAVRFVGEPGRVEISAPPRLLLYLPVVRK